VEEAERGIEAKERSYCNTFHLEGNAEWLNFRSVFIHEGRTIFQFQKSFLFSQEEKASFPEEMQTEIVATVSFFCAPTSNLYGLWPYHTPNYSAASDTLKRRVKEDSRFRQNNY
jgi:hypothetical protein